MHLPGNKLNNLLNYNRLNQISKYPQTANLLEISRVDSITVWCVLNKKAEGSSKHFNNKVLLNFLLLFLIGDKTPQIVKSSLDKDLLIIKNYFSRSNKSLFLEKFLSLYCENSTEFKFSENNIIRKLSREILPDSSFFPELEDFTTLFEKSNPIRLNISLSSSCSRTNFLFLNSLFKGSSLNKK
jgi:hypothetical protein